MIIRLPFILLILLSTFSIYSMETHKKSSMEEFIDQIEAEKSVILEVSLDDLKQLMTTGTKIRRTLMSGKEIWVTLFLKNDGVKELSSIERFLRGLREDGGQSAFPFTNLPFFVLLSFEGTSRTAKKCTVQTNDLKTSTVKQYQLYVGWETRPSTTK